MRRLLWFTVGFASICAIGVYLASGVLPLWLLAVFLPLAILLLLIRNNIVNIAGAICVGITFGILWLCGYNYFYLEPVKPYDGQLVEADFEISDYSYETRYGYAVDAKVSIGGRKYSTRIYFNEKVELSPGDAISGRFTIGMTLPGGTEAATYYQAEGIFLLAEAEGEFVHTPAEHSSAKYFPAELRRWIKNTLSDIFPEDVLGFVRALLLGDDSLLTYEQDTAFRVSGIRHVIAVSGLHVSILFALCYALAGRQRYLTAIIGIPVLVLFAAVAGFTPSIIRACIMQSLMMIALLVNEEYDPPTALAFAVLVMLLLNPAVVASVNLQLSVGCMIGIIAFSKRLSQAVLRRLGWPTGLSMWARFARGFSGSVGVTISAMSLTIPLTSAYFGMVSVIGVFANIIALWVISFIFYGILFACTLAAVLPILGKVIAWIIAWPARYVLCVAELCASVPFAAVYTSSIYIVIWIVICYLIFLSLFLFQEKPLLLSTACAAVCLCAAIGVTCFEARQDELRITAFDVGEGQAVLIQCEGYNFLVDCGGDNPEEAADMVAETLLNQGVFTLDGLILTHYDADHAAGVMYLLSRVDADVLYLPRIADNSSHKAEIVDNFEDKIMWIYGLTEIIPGNGRFSLIPAVSDANDPNESSLCVLFQREEYDILITGDRGYAGEKALIESYDLPKLELLIAGHHGAKTSTCFELLSVTQPETVVISTAGRYGHPNEDVLYRLSLFDCNVLRTDQEGTLIFRR